MQSKSKNVAARLLKTSQKHIAKYGLENFDTQSIAKAAGTSNSQIYVYYQNRDGLIADVFSAGWDILDDQIERKLLSTRNNKPQEVIQGVSSAIFDAFVENTDQISATMVLWHTTGSPLRDTLERSWGSSQRRQFVRQLATVCGAKLPEESVEVIAETIFGILCRLLFCLTPYKNHRRLTKVKLAKQRQKMEVAFTTVVETLLC